MGILKKCLSVEKTPNEPDNQISSLPVSDHSVPPTEAVPLVSTEADALTPVEADPLTSMEGVFSHSVTSMEGVFGHSVPHTEAVPLVPTDRSQMNCASISDTAETPDSSSDRVVGLNNHSLLLQICLSHKIRWNLPMQTYSKVLVNFQEILTS